MSNAQERRLRAARPLPAKPVDRAIRVGLTGGMASYTWTLDGRAWPDVTPRLVKKGERAELAFVNETDMGHPMHLHGHGFLVTEINGLRIPGAMRDTVFVPARQTVKVQLDAAYPGYWMIHCHILYHQAAGMMAVLRYEGFENTSYDPRASRAEFRR